MKKHWFGSIVFIGVVVLIFGSIAAADAQEEKDVFTLEEIIVTAERRETSAQDTPVAVTAFTEEAMAQQGIEGVEDLELRMPSTSIPTWNKIYIRGIGRDVQELGVDPGVGVYSEGFYNQYQGALENSFDVARIESVRGPQSTLFGRNTIGGLIQVWYNPPSDHFTGQAKMQVFTYGYKGGIAFGGPLYKDKLMFRIRYIDTDQDGWYFNHYNQDYVGGEDGNTLNFALTFKPTDKLEVYTRYWRATRQGDQPQEDAGWWINDQPYTDATKSVYYTYPQETTPTLVRWMDPNTGVLWTRDENKRWFYEWNYGQSSFYYTGDPADPYYDEPNVSINDPWEVNFDNFGYYDYDGQGIQITTTYDVTDNLTFKLLTSYLDWDWNGYAEDDGTANPSYGEIWWYPLGQHGYTAELQAIYGGPDTKLSFIAGLYYLNHHEYNTWTGVRYGNYINDYLPNGPNPPAGHTTEWWLGGNKSTWGWYPVHGYGDNWHPLNTYGGYNAWIDTVSEAVYAQFDYQITDTVNITAGLRWLLDDKKGFEDGIWTGMTDDPPSGTYNEARYTEAQMDFLLNTYGITTHSPDFLDGGTIALGDPIEPARWGWFWYEDPVGSGNWVPFGPCAGYCDKPTGTWWGDFGGRTLQAEWDAWVGKFSVDWTPSDGSLLYVGYSRGQKSGGFRLGTYQPDDPANNAKLVYDPEFLSSYEAGWKQMWLGGRLRTGFTVYNYLYDDAQLVTVTGGVVSIRNIGAPTVWGIEVDGEGYITDRLRANLAYSYMKGEYASFWTEDLKEPWLPPVNVKGNQLKNSPEHKYAIGATYTHPTGIGDVSLHASYFWRDTTETSATNNWYGHAPAFGKMDARMWWNSPDYKWRISFSVDNVFEEEGVRRADQEPIMELRRVYMIAPRITTLEVSFKW